MTKLALALLVTAFGIAGCGGSSDKSSEAASCLKNAVNNPSGSDCGSYIDGGFTPPAASARCTLKVGNDYTCATTDQSGNDTFYDVTYDGKRITYQPSR